MPLTTDPALPLISVVTPSYNQGRFIRATIESVLSQNYPNIEYWVIDGGSTDATLSIVREHEGDPRFHWLSEADGGQADAINKGVALTCGDIVAWLNSDDVYAPGAVSRAVEEILTHPAVALVYGQAERIDRSGTVIGQHTQIEAFDLQRLIHHLDFIVQPATFFRRAPFMAVGGLDASLHYCLDYDLWIKLGLRYPVRYIPDVLARAREYPETKTASGSLERLVEIERMIRRYGRPILPSLYYGEMVKACWRAGLRALYVRDWRRWWSAWGRGGFYLAAALVRKVRDGR
jgi:glycosyltransferase involved in cell wall biosynthesis